MDNHNSWPMPRHDVALTGRSEGIGKLIRPRVVARAKYADRGEAVLWDAGGGVCCAVAGGRILASFQGNTLWQTDVMNPLILGFCDLAGTGEAQLIASIELRTLAVFSVSDGRMLWSYRFPRKTVMLSHNRLKIGSILEDVAGGQISVWPEGDDDGYLFAFDRGVEAGYLRWVAPGIGVGDRTRYNPNVLVAEFDRRRAIFVIQHSRIWAIDPESGARLAEIDGPNMRNYGYAGFFDADGDGKSELVLVNDAVQLHISVVRLGADGMEYLWDKYIGYGETVMKTPCRPVGDMSGGRVEIVYSVGDVETKRWRVEILNARTGDVSCLISDRRALDWRGAPEPALLLENALTSEVEIWTRVDDEYVYAYSLDHAPGGEWSAPAALNESHIARARSMRFFGEDGALIEAKEKGLAGDAEPLTPLALDIDGDGRCEILVGADVYRFEQSTLRRLFRMGEDENLRTYWGASAGYAFLGAFEYEDEMRLLYRNTDAELVMADKTGRVLWRKHLLGGLKGGRIMHVTLGRFLAMDRTDIFCNVATTATYINESVMIDARDGEVIWRRADGHDSGLGPVDGYAGVLAWQADGLDDLLFLSGEVLLCMDGATGEFLLEKREISEILKTRWVGSGQFTRIDADGDGEEELYLSGVWGLNGGLLKWDGEYYAPVWFDYYGNATPIGTPPRFSHQGMLRMPDGRWLASGPTNRYTYACVDAATGEMAWEIDMHDHVATESCTGDIDGDGLDEVIWGQDDGYLYAYDAHGTEKSRVFVGAPCGSPVLADVDGDGYLEIIVTNSIGEVLVIAAE